MGILPRRFYHSLPPSQLLTTSEAKSHQSPSPVIFLPFYLYIFKKKLYEKVAIHTDKQFVDFNPFRLLRALLGNLATGSKGQGLIDR